MDEMNNMENTTPVEEAPVVEAPVAEAPVAPAPVAEAPVAPAPAAVPAAPVKNGKGLCIAGLVLGIFAAAFAWWGLVYGIIAFACGIVGIILSAKGKKQAKVAGVGTGMGTAGLVLAIIGTVLSVIGLIACGICAAAAAAAQGAGVDADEIAGILEGVIQ